MLIDKLACQSQLAGPTGVSAPTGPRSPDTRERTQTPNEQANNPVRGPAQCLRKHAVRIVFVEPDDIPASVIIHWPPTPTKINPRRFRDTPAAVARMFSEANIALARIKARRRL